MLTIKLLNLYDFKDKQEGLISKRTTPNPAAENSPCETLKSPSSVKQHAISPQEKEIKCFCIHSVLMLRKPNVSF